MSGQTATNLQTVDADKISTVLLVGAGIMGAGIALNFAQAGLTVRVVDVSTDSLKNCESQIGVNLDAFQEFELLTEAKDTILDRISYSDADDLMTLAGGCDYVVEAMPEVMELKRELFAKLDALPGGVVIGSNTSSLTVTKMADGMNTAERVVGLHYFNPAHIIPAVEIHRGESTDDTAVDITMNFMKRVGKKPVRVRKEVPGFIINRLTGAMEREIDYLLDEGIVSPEDLDIAVKASYGFRLACLGPMEAEDMIGLDTAARASGNIFPVLSNASDPSPGILEKVDRGELGIKSGKGWYDYSDRSKEAVLDGNNRRLLRQLKLFLSAESD